MKAMTQISIRDVVAEGVCVGCGACSVATQGRIRVAPNVLGVFQADIKNVPTADLDKASKVCPFSEESVDEDQLSQELFAGVGVHDPRLGTSSSIFAARVVKGEDIKLSSSGGLTSWLTLKLLEAGSIDGVIHVAAGQHADGDHLFEYVVSRTPEEVRERRKSQYYSTSLAAVALHIRNDGKKYALVGVPCFIKAARLLAREDESFRAQLAVCIGLVCGHLKSSGFAELLAWQVGIPPSELLTVDFRVKEPGKTAGDYGFGAKRQGASQLVTRPTRSLLGGNWGHAMFQLKACDYCDDIFAETADIAFGDAWLPQYSNDWRGTNVVVCRSKALESILLVGAERGEIMLEPLSADLAAESQGGNYRHRWDGLSLRLADDRAAGVWAPRKRIAPGSRPLSKSREKIVRLRRKLASLSHEAFAEAKVVGSLNHFERRVRPLVDAMDKEYGAADRPLLRRIARKIKSTLASAFR
jgi:coenzyme F420 hydrogenase subunit beta